MLRVSAKKARSEVDIQGIAGDANSAAVGIAFGAELMRFAESVATRDDASLGVARTALLNAAGAQALVEVAGVAANFQRMVRIADAIGIPFDDMESNFSKRIQAELGLTRFASASHSVRDGADQLNV